MGEIALIYCAVLLFLYFCCIMVHNSVLSQGMTCPPKGMISQRWLRKMLFFSQERPFFLGENTGEGKSTQGGQNSTVDRSLVHHVVYISF